MPKTLTLKEERLLKELPKNNYNISKAGLKAGYTKATTRSGNWYNQIRALTLRYANWTKDDIAELQATALSKYIKDNDNSNIQRAIEYAGNRIVGLADKKEVNTTLTDERKQELNRLYDRVIGVDLSPTPPLS